MYGDQKYYLCIINTLMKHIFASICIPVLLLLVFAPHALSGQSAQPSIMFFIHNPQVNGNFYEFDVYAVVSNTGSFHSRGQLYLNYNSAAFGSNVAANNRVQVTHLTLLNDSVPNIGPKYSTVNIYDNTASRFAVSWASNFLFVTPGPQAHTEMRPTPTALYHIKLEILNPSVTLALSLHGPLMQNEQFYLTAPFREAPYRMTPFAVEWADISVESLEAGKTLLNWTTARESNSAYFEVEKQQNGGDFSSIAQVIAAGHSNAKVNYAYLDETGVGENTVYRIRQVDQNGHHSYSPAVELQGTSDISMTITGFPNPMGDKLHIEIHNPQSSWISLQLTNMQGQQIAQHRLWLEANQLNNFSLDVSHLSPGCYFMECLVQGTQARSKVLKMMKQ